MLTGVVVVIVVVVVTGCCNSQAGGAFAGNMTEAPYRSSVIASVAPYKNTQLSS